ncbi:hypothetical protein F0562_033232 [Nyssa sinensis]|uniref:ABC transmembrane type-1 domain-containing protein n=1 Tax=Nyssa sinensis TaxID=561372 RepID=A0A5J5AQ36_9ASTE|nr:hypothetical protein F0562_033232 [Nyssa sinensis]
MGAKGGIFLYADSTDKLLILFGTLGSIGDGMSTPLTMIILSGVINVYGSSEFADTSFANHEVDKFGLRLLCVAIGTAISASIEGICWTRTAERQTSRMRTEYLKSVLNQEVAYFDNQVGSSTNFQVISGFFSDAQSIHDVMAEKSRFSLQHPIKENILFGKEGAPMELVVSTAKAANAHKFITKLPDGYDTQVGQSGVKLSGGQKQRIAIARALLKDPRILLLDEATSSLDAKSERKVQEALDEASLGRTTIIIAHRLATIRKANTIVVLQLGRVIESGSHDKLIQINNGEGGAYFRMLKLQQSSMLTEEASLSYPPLEARSHCRQSSSQSPQNPVSARSSGQSSPSYPFSPALSFSGPQSFDMHPNDQSVDKYLAKSSHLPHSQWHLVQMIAPEWKRSLLGCLGAIGAGSIQPFNAYCLGSLVSVYLLKDNSKIKSDTDFFCFIFLSLAVFSFITNLLQHYDFSVTGECLTKRVREKVLCKCAHL